MKNPKTKSEIRNPKQTRSTKLQTNIGSFSIWDFEFGICFAFRISSFGFRIWCFGFFLLAAGCSKLKPVEGMVTLDGKPIHLGAITFMPEDYGAPPAAGPIVAGKFRMHTKNKGGAMRGKYKVVISSSRNGRETLPAAYSNSQKSILTFEVPPEGADNVLFALDSKGSPPPPPIQASP